jgi:hypothetical protein
MQENCVKTLCQIVWIRLTEYPPIHLLFLKDQKNKDNIFIPGWQMEGTEVARIQQPAMD